VPAPIARTLNSPIFGQKNNSKHPLKLTTTSKQVSIYFLMALQHNIGNLVPYN